MTSGTVPQTGQTPGVDPDFDPMAQFTGVAGDVRVAAA
jgi:hypothetical protein